MRHSGTPRRLVAVVVLSVLVGATVGLSAPVLAQEPSSDPFLDRLGLVAEADNGRLTRSGTRGMVDPKLLPEPSKTPSKRPTKPSLSRTAPSATAPKAPAPTGVGPPDPVEVTLTGNPPAGQPGFDGFSLTSGPATAFQPPDPWVAVGPDHVIQTVNTSMQILDRSGNLLEEADLADFFLLPPGYGLSDPRVIFDALHQRWVMTEVSWICLAAGGGVGYIDYLVSSTADPTDPWRLDFLQFNNVLPDYPAPGTSTVNLAFAINAFAMDTTPGDNCLGAGTTYFGTDMLFVDWAEIVRPASAPPTNVEEFLFPEVFFTARVAVQTPATSPTLQAVVQLDEGGVEPVQPFYVSFEGSAAAGTIEPAAASPLTNDAIVAEWVEPPDPQQPGATPTVTNRIDARPTDAIWQDNKLTWVSTHGCVPSGDISLRACQRVTQIDTTGTFENVVLPTAVQDFLIAGADAHNYYGGVGQALDGTLHVVWTRSSAAAIYPSSYSAYQLPGDPVNSLSTPELLQAGVGPSFTGGRWGDYNGVAQDPQVPNAVWQANMYSGGGSLWKTFNSQLQTGGSTFVPITPVRVLDTRPAFNIGLSGVFSHGVARSWDVAGFGPTIPPDAIAVTGNLTVVNQTAGGYVSVTPAPNNNPASSTINFPLGDNRANNVTIPVNAGDGKISAVYRASAGKTTHLIFDVTGYFLAGPSEAEYQPITPIRALDTRFDVGLADAFQKNVPRRLSIGPEHVPAAAVAISGNLTVVGQTGAGFLSITPNSDASPETSNLNFPLGDVRANGFVARLNNQDDFWIVYETTAPGARSAHVLLDVTGYFVNDPSGLQFYPLTPGRVMDTRAGAVLTGLSGAFSANTPRRLDVAGHWGVPAGANAITGNLTVVNQTAAGYVSATLASDPDPDTSVLNFPLGDTRANGAALPLNGTGRSWFVYKLTPGKTTHLIFDLSGYFD